MLLGSGCPQDTPPAPVSQHVSTERTPQRIAPTPIKCEAKNARRELVAYYCVLRYRSNVCVCNGFVARGMQPQQEQP
jgi:hypothetical protein